MTKKNSSTTHQDSSTSPNTSSTAAPAENPDRPKEILDKYQPLIIRRDKVYEKDGVAQVNTHETERYTPENYSNDIVLQIAPKDAITVEFEDEPEKNLRFIAEMEDSCNAQNIQYCITEHEGGKSPYLRIYNIKGMPVNYDNRIAKDLLIETIISSGAKEQLDRTNLGWTYSPVIGHPHWKPKYQRAIHRIIRGIHPLEQVNEYPTQLLKKIEKAKKQTKFNTTEILRNNSWVNDFLINYCTNNQLPKGARHYTIEKNLAALIYHRTDREEVLERYLKTQGRNTNTLRTWFNAIAGGQYTEVSVGEIKRYIEENNISYVIPKATTETTEKTSTLTNDHIKILEDPKLLLKIIDLVHLMGIVGEENTILTLVLKTSLRLVKEHKPTSSNMVVSDVSGAGKDAITGAVLKVLVPEDKLKHRTRFSDRALEYLMVGKDEKETLDGTVFYLEDPEEEMIKSQAFRVLSSGQNEATVVKDQEILELKVKGKPVIIVTSMSTNIDIEGERRWDAVQTDTSEKLTKLVLKEKLRVSKDGTPHMAKPPLAQAVQSLKPYEVIIPYADLLYQYFEVSPSLMMRTRIDNFLDYMRASTVLHQYQREKDSKGRLIANGFDYMYAKYVFTCLGDAEGGMLNPVERKLVEILKTKGEPVPISDLVSTKGFPRSTDWVYKHLDNLKSRHIIGEQSEWDGQANKNVTKIYCDMGTSGLILPKGSVLLGFIGGCENQNKIGFIGFIGFINIVKELNVNRTKVGLSALLFDDIDDKQKTLAEKIIKPIKPDDLPVGGFIAPCENLIKPHDKYTHADVKNYIMGVESKLGKGVTLELLCDQFPDTLVMDLLQSGLLVPHVDNSGFRKYTWQQEGLV